MKLNHNQIKDLILHASALILPLSPDIPDGAHINIGVKTKGSHQEFELTIYQNSYYSDYRYMWE